MNKKFLPVTVIFICVILTFLYRQFIFIPVQNEISNMHIESRRLHAVEKSLRDLKMRHDNFPDFVENTEIQLIELQNLLPDKPLQEKFTASIYKIAEKNKIAVTNLQVGDSTVTDNKNLLRHSIKIKLEGDYISILNFLREIIDGERFTKLENITLENNRDNLINCDAEFYIYSITQAEKS